MLSPFASIHSCIRPLWSLFTPPLSTPSSPVTCPACPPPLPQRLHLFYLPVSAKLTFCLPITPPSSFPSMVSAFILSSLLHAPWQCPPPSIYPVNIPCLPHPDPSVTSSLPHLPIFFSPSIPILTSPLLPIKYHCHSSPISTSPPS